MAVEVPGTCKSSVLTSDVPEGSGTSEAAAISRACSGVMRSRESFTAGSLTVSNSDTVLTCHSRSAGLSGTPRVPSMRGCGGCAT
ncbi:hypothetical protein G6F50_018149 [Rhizopus delemar]|uniref:Uncharacterized protein n=1 Tax=Rhizopus delemar TaxID=936053 RepID=A0A9P6XN21_9FUNG|nr:hypothetical protein G6F50_018149 [Rhizopus delemar]